MITYMYVYIHFSTLACSIVMMMVVYNMTMVFSESTVFAHNTSYPYSIDQFGLSGA